MTEILPVAHSLTLHSVVISHRPNKALHLPATYLYRRTAPTVKPTKEKATIKMDVCILDSDRVVSSTKKKIHRNMKTVDSTSSLPLPQEMKKQKNN